MKPCPVALSVASGLLALASCATTSTTYPDISKASIEARTPAIQAGLVDAILARQSRVEDLAWPLLVANAGLCHDRVRQAFGLTVGNAASIRAMADGLTASQVEAIGYTEAPVVLSVIAGSPAHVAGIRPGAVPVTIGETDIDGQISRIGEALAAGAGTRAETAPGKDAATPLDVVFEQDGDRIAASLVPVTVCGVTLKVRETDTVNASANTATLNINRGLLMALEDDRDVSLVIAHELGHVIGRHVPKLERNAAVSGIYVWGVPVALGAGLVDLTVGRAMKRFGGSESLPGASFLTSIQNRVLGVREFEREADYLSVYITARAGGDLDRLEHVFEAFSTLSARSTYGERSHPVTADRMLAIAAAREEVRAKQASGAPLVPEGWPWPVPGTPAEAPENRAGADPRGA